ncbi:hypothetical protein [Aquibacillus albus]|uniref:Uncharacterized protein n=1 Tax=Aquibacillus albus TaxID=1168171 RepID=A0ABS2MW97_9BACI|nr:hypothetical protein [Aquibacillus albus]MBM7570161.1 hypothetical protein [Aquibacillus albus]
MNEHWKITLSEHISIVFGLTSGILTLLGLIAIFVSLNSQHNVEKARETIWELMKYPHKHMEFRTNLAKQKEIREEINYHLFIYKNIMSGGRDFTSKIIQISKIIIWAVCIIWLTSLYFVTNKDSTEFYYILASTVLVILIMLTFIWILTKLKNIPQISKLPSYHELLNCKNKAMNLDMLLLAAMMMQIHIVKSKQEGTNTVSYTFFAKFPKPMYGFNVEFNPPVESAFNEEIVLNDDNPLPKVKIKQEKLEKIQLTGEPIMYSTVLAHHSYNEENDLLDDLMDEKSLEFTLKIDKSRTIKVNYVNEDWSSTESFPYEDGVMIDRAKKLKDIQEIAISSSTSTVGEHLDYNLKLKHHDYCKIDTLGGETITGKVVNLGSDSKVGWYYEILTDDAEQVVQISYNGEDPPKLIYNENGLIQWVHPSLYEGKFLYTIFVTYVNKLSFLYKSILRHLRFVFHSIVRGKGG